VLTKITGLLLILSVFAFACDKEEQQDKKAANSGQTSTPIGSKAETTTVANVEKVPRNLLVMQYYALPG